MADQLVGPQKFFLVVPPRFERLALYELVSALKKISIEVDDYQTFVGGIEVTLPFAVGLSLNSILKIPTRILLRLASRQVLSYGELGTFLKTIPWAEFMPLRKVYVSSRSSRLKMKDDVKEYFHKNIQFKTEPHGTDVYLRFFRDECTLSLDTSGEDLYMRGYDKWTGEAPIRDNMAAGLLRFALQGVDDLSEWEVIDPMMGSGTFLLEAFSLNKPLKRKFCYQNWASGKDIVSVFAEDTNAEKPKSPRVRGADKNLKTYETAKKNFATVRMNPGNLKNADLFDVKNKGGKSDRRSLVVVNPPYGKRLGIKEKDLFNKILSAVNDKYEPDRLGVLVPHGAVPEHSEYECVRRMPFSNNGIDVEFFLYLKKQKAPSGASVKENI